MPDAIESEIVFDDLSPAEQLTHFKAVVKSLMDQAGTILAEIDLHAAGKGIEERISMLDHCLDYTRRLCERSGRPT